MRRLKLKTIAWWNKLLILLLGILGIGCDPTKHGVIVMYGCPTADISIKGTVTNEENTPIPGIQITTEYLDTLRADAEGKFSIEGEIFPVETIQIKAEDIDSTENGEYLTDSVNVELNYTDSDGAWYYGKAEAEIEITLKKKE